MEYNGYLMTAFIVTFFSRVNASHFKGGTIFWKPTGNGVEVNLGCCDF